jgi:hypothetical protein
MVGMQKFIGFYWTLPVPWAGFNELPKDLDAAADASKTIRYQRERVRKWAKAQKGTLIHEEVFMELLPDRGSEQIAPAIDMLLSRCREENATLLLVDFSQAFGWRRHGALYDKLRDESLSITLEPEPVEVDGALFDPIGHFRSWRDLQDAFVVEKSDRKAAIQAAIANYGATNTNLATLVAALNRDGIRTPTGKRWTEDNLRKFLKSL